MVIGERAVRGPGARSVSTRGFLRRPEPEPAAQSQRVPDVTAQDDDPDDRDQDAQLGLRDGRQDCKDRRSLRTVAPQPISRSSLCAPMHSSRNG